MKILRIASIIIMVIITTVSIIFAHTRTKYAEDAFIEAETQKARAGHNIIRTEKQTKLTEAVAVELQKVEAALEGVKEELKNCQNR